MDGAGRSSPSDLAARASTSMPGRYSPRQADQQQSHSYTCQNCNKVFARGAREMRAAVNPTMDRQKSCYACARSKARCDLGYPACDRCRKRRLQCVYAPHTGNPNVRKAREQGLLHVGWQETPIPMDVCRTSYTAPTPGRPLAMGEDDGIRRSAHAPRRASDSLQWQGSLMPDLRLSDPLAASTASLSGTSMPFAEVSGDEFDSDDNHTTDSLEASFTGMGWKGAPNAAPVGSPASFSSSSSAESGYQLRNVAAAQTWPVAAQPQLYDSRDRACTDYAMPPPAAPPPAAQQAAPVQHPLFQVPPQPVGVHGQEEDTGRLGYTVIMGPPPTAAPGIYAPGTGAADGGEPIKTDMALRGDEPQTAEHAAATTAPVGAGKQYNNPTLYHAEMPTLDMDALSAPNGPPLPILSQNPLALQAPEGAAPNNGKASEALGPLPRLSTSNLQLAIPQTPSRISNYALFSPGHSAMVTGNMDISAWLDEPVVPSPLYELGACTGWSGLMPAVDLGKTPTALTARGERPFLQGSRLLATHADTLHCLKTPVDAPLQRTSPSTSPVLISSIDWWAKDTDAQSRFHRYMVATLPVHGLLRVEDSRSTLATSAVSRFLTYCSFMCMAEPSSPQPPFLHRALLLARRDRLPAPLAIARSALSALSLRLPTSEVWAWMQIGTELTRVVNEAQSVLVRVKELRLRGEGAPEMQRWWDHAMDIDGGMDLVAPLQALWFYTVVGAFGDTLDVNAPATFSLKHRVWDPSLLPRAIDTLQALTGLVAHVAMRMQRRGWSSAGGSEKTDDVAQRQFMWWGFCESIRRSVLVSNALLILLRYAMHATCPSADSSMVLLGRPPFPTPLTSDTLPSDVVDWDTVVCGLELPAVADVFEADTPALWNTRRARHADAREIPRSLALLIQQRPNAPRQQSAPQYMLDNYFHQHDEFTNVCLSIIFGLTIE
ncbi:hypothetical protein MSPP1_001287 [Malassezia sp. CBS 17886]|nr:hypothetical protein MSPP1_001287 [Malassezia sp. CBS 17886]